MNKEELIEINKIVKFNSIEELKNYKDIEYVETLIYGDEEMLKENDLPNNGILKTIKLLNNSLSKISGRVIPNGVIEIHYPWENETDSINLRELPKSVESIYNYQGSLDETTIPNNIKLLSFRCYSEFNERITNETFKSNGGSSLTSLDLGDNWNNGGFKLNGNEFPNSLINLEIRGFKLENETSSSSSFNLFPKSLKSLTISHNDNIELPSLNSLPNLNKLSITSILNKGLIISSKSNLSNALNLKSLKLMTPDLTILPCSNIKNSNIKNLEIYIGFKGDNAIKLTNDLIPLNLESLIMDTQFNKIDNLSLPSTLKKLHYSLYGDLSINEFNLFNSDGQPNLDELYINFKSSDDFTSLIPKSKSLIFGSNIEIGKSVILSKLPSSNSIESLEFKYSLKDYKFKIGDFGLNLKKLILSTCFEFNSPIEKDVLPKSLEYLEMGSGFNNPIFELPQNSNLKSLKFPFFSKFNQILKINQLPNTLEELQLNSNYTQPINQENQLPSSLIILTIPKNNNQITSIPSVKLINKI